MDTTTLTRRQKLALAAGAFALLLGGSIAYDAHAHDGGSPRFATTAGKPSLNGGPLPEAKSIDVDPCAFLTSEEIEAATGLEGMDGHDEGTSSGTGARVCQYDQGTGELPTLTVFARPTQFEDLGGEKSTYIDFARETYQGEDLPGVADAAYITPKNVYVQHGDVTLEISTLVMKGFLPGSIEGEPLKELARAAATVDPTDS